MSRQVALVTGSSRGIGRAAAIELAREGFAVAINGRSKDDAFKKAIDAVAAEGVPVCGVAFDVSDIGAHDDQLAMVEAELGPLTTLVNNAGVGVLSRGDLLDVTEESYDRCLNVNTKALFFFCQAFSKRLLARDRDPALYHSIVNVSSSNAVAVAVQRGEYCASKAAAAMISKTFAVRLGAENISVFDVQPGLIATDMTAAVIDTYDQRAKDGLTVIPRVGQSEEMGRVIACLASGKMPYTTGQTISADGGMLIPRF